MLKNLLLLLLFIPCYLIPANQHLQTSANPLTSVIEIVLHEGPVQVNLDKPGVDVKKFPDGKLEQLEFIHENSVHRVIFYESYGYGEKIKDVLRFTTLNGRLVLNGPTRHFTEEGILLSEQNWNNGKLHGVQKFFDDLGNLREETYFSYGYPVETWKTYYHNGIVATEITFPPGVSEWKETELVSYNMGKKETLKAYVKRVPIFAKEIWFSIQGYKQREIDLNLYKNGDIFVIAEKGTFRSFDEKGNVIGERFQRNNYSVHRKRKEGDAPFTFAEFRIRGDIFKKVKVETFGSTGLSY